MEAKKRVVKRTPAKRAGEARYKKENQKKVTVNFLPPTMHLHDYLESKAAETGVTKAQYLRDLIRKDMEGSWQQQ